MNRIIYTLILFGFYIADMNAQSINLDTIYEPFKVPKGIYYSFDELKNKQPKEVLDFKIVKRSRKDISFNGGGVYGIELKNGTKRMLRKIGEACLGISDGKMFVVSGKYSLGGWRGYSKAYLSGPLFYVPFTTNLAQSVGGGAIPSLITTSRGIVFDVDKGKYYKLNKKLLASMIKKHHIKGFENKKLMKNVGDILIAVNKKRTSRG